MTNKPPHPILSIAPSVHMRGLRPPLWFALGSIAPLFRLLAHSPCRLAMATDGHLPTYREGHAVALALAAIPASQVAELLTVSRAILHPLGFTITHHDGHPPHLTILYAPTGRAHFPVPGEPFNPA